MTFGLCIELLWVSDIDTGPDGVFCLSRRKNNNTVIVPFTTET